MAEGQEVSPTEVALLATYRTPIIPLAKICKDYLGIGYERAKQLAALHRLPVPAYRLWESERAPLLVGSKDLAAYIDNVSEATRAQWAKSQL